MNNNYTIEEPLDLIKLSLGEKIQVKCRNEKILKGKLHVKCNFHSRLMTHI